MAIAWSRERGEKQNRELLESGETASNLHTNLY